MSSHVAGSYRRRIVDDELDELLTGLPAVSLDGPKGVGKTATAARRARTVLALDDDAVTSIVAADPSRLANAEPPVLVDEWQRLPQTWDVVRRAVDAGAEPGRFLLTGSASPQAPGTHSGAGRIVSVRMRPMSLAERGVASPTVSLRDLLAPRVTGPLPVTGASTLGLEDYVELIVAGGFPGITSLAGRARRASMASYVERIVDRDVPESGVTPRNPTLMRRWLRALAAATATTASFETLRDAATPGVGDKPARSTTQPYQDALTRIWIADPLPGWAPGGSRLQRLTLAPKHHLADPALAVALGDITADDLLAGRGPRQPAPRDGAYLGALFESLVTQSLRVYAQQAEARVFHARTKGGEHEVDLVVVAPGGRVLAIETKLARSVGDADVRHLHWLRERLGGSLVDALVVTTGPEAYRRADGIAVVPAALLGP